MWALLSVADSERFQGLGYYCADGVVPSAVVLLVILEQANPEFDDFVGIRVRAGRFDIYDRGDEFRGVIGRIVLGLRLQPTGDTVITAVDERSSHLFERRFHVADVLDSRPHRSPRSGFRWEVKTAARAALMFAINSAPWGLRSRWNRFASANLKSRRLMVSTW